MKVIDYGYLAHLYYGKEMDGDMSYVITHYDRGFSGNPYEAQESREFSLDNIPQEYSCYGNGDFRTPAFNVKDIEGIHGCDLRYVSYEVMDKSTVSRVFLQHTQMMARRARHSRSFFRILRWEWRLNSCMEL